METTELYELLDTIAKIGLGALIGGLFSLLSIRISNRHQVDSELRGIRRQAISDAHIAMRDLNKWTIEFFGSWQSYLYSTANPSQDGLGVALHEVSGVFDETVSALRRSISHLRLVGLAQVATDLEHYWGSVLVSRYGVLGEKALDIANVEEEFSALSDLLTPIERELANSYQGKGRDWNSKRRRLLRFRRQDRTEIAKQSDKS